MSTALAIAPERKNLSTALSPEDDIIRATEIWEQANNLLIDAGRLFAETKAGYKRRFNKLVEESSLEKAQVNKLIKAAQAADEIPSSVAARLGLPMLIQLGQPRSEPAQSAIATNDTQLSVAQKIKELRAPAQPKEIKPIRFIGGQKGGVGKLRIEVPGCVEAVELERDWKESGLPPLQWLQSRTVNAQDISPIPSSPRISVVDSSKSAVQAEPTEARASVSTPPSPTDEQASAGAAFLEMAQLDPQTFALISPAEDIQELLTPGLVTAFVAVQTGLESVTNILPSAVETSTELEVAQADLNGYLQAQAEAIAPENKKTKEDVKQVSLPLSQNKRDVYPASCSDIVGKEEAEISDDTSLNPEETDSLPLNPPILPTGRYKQGWQVGEYAVPNTTYGYLPMSFRLWCLGQPVLIVEVAGSTGTVQTLTVARHDGETHHAMGDWLEETTVDPLTLPTTTEPQGATPSDCYTSATPTLRYKQGWKVGDMALANTVGGEYFVNWCEGKPIRIEQATGGVGEIQILRVSRHDGVTDMSYGNWIEDVLANPASDDNPPSETAEFASLYKDEGCPGHTWVEYERLNKIPVEEQKAAVQVDRQEQLARDRAKEEITKTAKLIKQSNREIALSEEYLRQQSRYGDDLARAQDKIATNVNRRFQQIARVIDYAQLNGIWLDMQALKENRLVFEPDGPDEIADYLPMPWVKSQSPESPCEPITEPVPAIDYAALSSFLKKVHNWEEIASVVGRNASTFAAAVKDWTPEQKQVLINHTVNYMSDNPKAIFFHEFDWMPVQSLEKAFLKLSFKVRDITDGIGAAKWHNGCQFVSVSGYCKGEAEVWTFLKFDKSQIKAYGRDDFEVIGF